MQRTLISNPVIKKALISSSTITSNQANGINQLLLNQQAEQRRLELEKDLQTPEDKSAVNGNGNEKQKLKKDTAICSDYLAFKECPEGDNCTRRHLIGEEAVRKRYLMKIHVCSHNPFCFSRSCRKLRRHINFWKPSNAAAMNEESQDLLYPMSKDRLWEISIILKEELAHLSKLMKSPSPPKLENSYQFEAYKCIMSGLQRWLGLNYPVISISNSEEGGATGTLKPIDVVIEFLNFFIQNAGGALYMLPDREVEWIASLQPAHINSSNSSTDATSQQQQQSSSSSQSNSKEEKRNGNGSAWSKFLAMNNMNEPTEEKGFVSKVIYTIKTRKILYLNLAGLTMEETFAVFDEFLSQSKKTVVAGKVEVVFYMGDTRNKQMIPEMFIAAIAYSLLNHISFSVGYDSNYIHKTLWYTVHFESEKRRHHQNSHN